MGDDYDVYLEILRKYKTAGVGWDEFAKKARLNPDLRRSFARINRELRDYGFYGPEAIGDEIVCHTMVEPPPATKVIHRKNCRCVSCQ